MSGQWITDWSGDVAIRACDIVRWKIRWNEIIAFTHDGEEVTVFVDREQDDSMKSRLRQKLQSILSSIDISDAVPYPRERLVYVDSSID